MDYKIVKKDAFTVLAAAKKRPYDNAQTAVPEFWAEHDRSGKNQTVCGMYGINIDEEMGGKEFEYLLADDYDGKAPVPAGESGEGTTPKRKSRPKTALPFCLRRTIKMQSLYRIRRER